MTATPAGPPAPVTAIRRPVSETVRSRGARISQAPHGHLGAANEMLVSVRVREIEGVMRHHDLDRAGARLDQPGRRACDLRFAQAAAAVKRKVAGAVQPDRDESLAFAHRLQIFLNMPLIAAKGIEQTRGQIEERHVMISRDDEHWARQSIKEPARRQELTAARPLCQVT